MIERKPLTLEELRGRANKPYWHVGLRDDSGAPHWSILDPILAYHPEDYDYGKTWLDYAYEPPRLDRSAWEPCESCEDYSVKCCENCGNQGVSVYKEPCKSCHCANNWEPKKNFCPSCGRPLTDAAWKTLEKRLEINK